MEAIVGILATATDVLSVAVLGNVHILQTLITNTIVRAQGNATIATDIRQDYLALPPVMELEQFVESVKEPTTAVIVTVQENAQLATEKDGGTKRS